jgi:hypothetical protein
MGAKEWLLCKNPNLPGIALRRFERGSPNPLKFLATRDVVFSSAPALDSNWRSDGFSDRFYS